MSAPSPSDSLSNWLSWLEHLHPSEIDMGLQRVGEVADRLGVRPASMTIILVGGTNGKGSTVALLSDIYQHAGYRVGAYTSPHIDVFNERMCIDGTMLDDPSIVNALFAVENERKPESLTYFEYTTLAAMVAFERAKCDVVLLEVGLGGRLDATNLWDCDCAILTSIALDHQDYLGDTLEAIAAEKVAIGRSGKPLIVGEPSPPSNLLSIAKEHNMNVIHIDEGNLPYPALAGVHQQRNAACAVEAVAALQHVLPVKVDSVEAGLTSVYVPGRFERVLIENQLAVLDAAHNPAAAVTVCHALQTYYPEHRIVAVLSVLKDKDITGIVTALAPVVSSWYCATLPVPRATPLADLISQVEQCQDAPVQGFEAVKDAWRGAYEAANSAADDRPVLILVAGSFYTLAQMRDEFQVLEIASSVNKKP